MTISAKSLASWKAQLGLGGTLFWDEDFKSSGATPPPGMNWTTSGSKTTYDAIGGSVGIQNAPQQDYAPRQYVTQEKPAFDLDSRAKKDDPTQYQSPAWMQYQSQAPADDYTQYQSPIPSWMTEENQTSTNATARAVTPTYYSAPTYSAPKSSGPSFLDSLGSGITSLFKGVTKATPSRAPTYQTPAQTQFTAPAKQDNTMLIAGGVLLALGALIIVNNNKRYSNPHRAFLAGFRKARSSITKSLRRKRI